MFDPAPLAQTATAAEEFKPPRSLRNASLQALLATKRPAKRIWRKRGLDIDPLSVDHILACADGVRLTGRHTPAAKEPARGLVVLIHGWEGGHDSSYLYSLACALHVAGYATFRLNLRDHAETHGLNEQMFHSARIAEVLDAIRAVQIIETAQPLSVIGLSLGGNFALRVGLHGPAGRRSSAHLPGHFASAGAGSHLDRDRSRSADFSSLLPHQMAPDDGQEIGRLMQPIAARFDHAGHEVVTLLYQFNPGQRAGATV